MLFYIIHREGREKERGVVCGSDKYGSKDESDGWRRGGVEEEESRGWKGGGQRGVKEVFAEWVGVEYTVALLT